MIKHGWTAVPAYQNVYKPAMHKTPVPYLGREDPLEEGMATHSSILAWRILWTESSRLWVHGVSKSQTRWEWFSARTHIRVTTYFKKIVFIHSMGNTCKPIAVSFQCMTKSTTIKKKKKERKNCLYPTGAIFNNGYVICLAITSYQAITFITGKMGKIVDNVLVLSPQTYMTSWDL